MLRPAALTALLFCAAPVHAATASKPSADTQIQSQAFDAALPESLWNLNVPVVAKG